MDIVKLSVYALVFNEKGEVLLQKRANTRFASGWWSLPGGHVESGEALSRALERELYEECALSVQPDFCSLKLTLVRRPDEGTRYVNFFYRIEKWEGTPIIADGKASELAFYSPSGLPEIILPHIKEALFLIEKGVHFHEAER
ncbi:MAG: NUDIX domain-containing protein [Chlamydiia bacterium]|nr:NUDIX domain-containing protein [Chlamydiia bacterium]